MKIIAIANQKGGVGKTITTLTLGAVLAEKGYKVLMIDLDPQSSLTQNLGINAAEQSIAEVIGSTDPGPLRLADVIRNISPGLDLAPSDIALANNELGLVVRLGRERVLKEALETVSENYDLCLLDCPPSLGILTINGLVAAAAVICPTLPAAPDLRGLALFLRSIEKVRKQINPDLEVLGVLITQLDPRPIAHKAAVDTMKDAGIPLLKTTIPRAVAVQEAAGKKIPLTTYAPKSKPAIAYKKVAVEVEKWLNRK